MKINLPITGMSCAACASRIEKGLGAVEGVTQATVNFAAENAMVRFDPRKTALLRLIDKLKDLGYDARTEKVLLPIRGMSCAACVGRVEKALHSVSGVIRVEVNFATEKASVEYLPGAVGLSELRGAVRDAGYEILDAEEEDVVEKERLAREKDLLRLKIKFTSGLFLLFPILLLMYGAPFLEGLGISRDINFLIQFLLATPVQFWVGRSFYLGF